MLTSSLLENVSNGKAFEFENTYEQNKNPSLYIQPSTNNTTKNTLHTIINDYDTFALEMNTDGHISFSSTLLTLYTMIQKNEQFAQYIFSCIDIDQFLLPLLRYLNHCSYHQYTQYTDNCNILSTIYVILIILLIFSTDSIFIKTSFQQIIFAHKNTSSPTGNNAQFRDKMCIIWYKKIHVSRINNYQKDKNVGKHSVGGYVGKYVGVKNNIQYPISLGSLIFLSLLDLLFNNVVNICDSYIHENCLAILINISSYAYNLHNYTVKQLTNFMNSFLRKINHKLVILIERIKYESKKEELQSVSNSNQIIYDSKFLQVLSMTLRLLKICRILIGQQLMPGNKFVLYSLLQMQSNLEKCCKLCNDGNIISLGSQNENDLEVKMQAKIDFCTILHNIGYELLCILEIVDYFHSKIMLHAMKFGVELDVGHVLDIIEEETFQWKVVLATENQVRNEQNNGGSVNENILLDCELEMRVAEYEYEESEDSLEFFLPFIWRLISSKAGIHFLEYRTKLF